MDETRSHLAFVCGYAEDDSGGVFTYRSDPERGQLQELNRTPSKGAMFLAVHPDRTHLYTVNQTSGGVVSAYRIDGPDGGLTEINRQSSEGVSPCYVSVDDTGNYAFVANYGEGTVAMLPIEDDGEIGAATDVVVHDGSSADPDGQQEAHPHSIGPGPQNRFAYAPDLGTDRVMIYRIDHERGRLRPADSPYVELHDGAGPRHFEFHPNGRFVYVISELDSTISAFEHDPETGALDTIETVSALPESFDGESYCADIHFHPSGRWMYGSNRGHDSIAVFEVDDETGRLRVVDHESTRGHWPRNFALDPAGDHLYVENQRSDSIVPFEVDPDSGRLTAIDRRQDLPEPLCMRFVKLE